MMGPPLISRMQAQYDPGVLLDGRLQGRNEEAINMHDEVS